MQLAYDVRIEHSSRTESRSAGTAPIGRYRGTGRVPMSYLPLPPARVNAYLIHGGPDARCYMRMRRCPARSLIFIGSSGSPCSSAEVELTASRDPGRAVPDYRTEQIAPISCESGARCDAER